MSGGTKDYEIVILAGHGFQRGDQISIAGKLSRIERATENVLVIRPASRLQRLLAWFRGKREPRSTSYLAIHLGGGRHA